MWEVVAVNELGENVHNILMGHQIFETEMREYKVKLLVTRHEMRGSQYFHYQQGAILITSQWKMKKMNFHMESLSSSVLTISILGAL